MTQSFNAIVFDGIPTAPYSPVVRGANFAVSTYYIPLPWSSARVMSLQVSGDGTAVASFTIEHSNMPLNFDGTTIDPRVAGLGHMWAADPAVGAPAIAASTGATGTAFASWSNTPRRISRVKLVVTVGGRLVGAVAGIG